MGEGDGNNKLLHYNKSASIIIKNNLLWRCRVGMVKPVLAHDLVLPGHNSRSRLRRGSARADAQLGFFPSGFRFVLQMSFIVVHRARVAPVNVSIVF